MLPTLSTCLIALTALAANPVVTVRPLAGDSQRGQLVELSADKLTLQTDTGAQQFKMAELMWLEFPTVPPVGKPQAWIELLDGSRIVAASFAATEGKARITLAAGSVIELPTRAVHTVRFQEQTPELALQWREITSSMASGDQVVIRKTSMRTIEQGESEPRTITEQALDQVEGTLLDVTADSVLFQLDGEKVPIRREKLEGLVYYQPTRKPLSPPLARLIDAAGSNWLLHSVLLAGDRLQAKSQGGINLDLPLTGLAKLDFSIGNVAFLSDLEPDSGAGEISLSLQPAAMSYKFSRVFQMQTVPPLGAESFKIGGQRFENGLSLHSPAKLVYRVPESFRWFHAVAGVDDSVVAPGRFNLVIAGDGQELARHSFSPDERRRPLPLTIDVKGLRRITIALESASGQDIGDQLDLCEARFTK